MRKTFCLFLSLLVLSLGPQTAGYRLAAEEIAAPGDAHEASVPDFAAENPIESNIAPLDLSGSLAEPSDALTNGADLENAGHEGLPAQTKINSQIPATKLAHGQRTALSENSTSSKASPAIPRTPGAFKTTLSISAGTVPPQATPRRRPATFLHFFKGKKFFKFLADSQNPDAPAETLREDAQLDLNDSQAAAIQADSARTQRAALLRAVLGQGTQNDQGEHVNAFIFHIAGGQPDEMYSARNAGLEGFVYSKKEISRDLGPDGILHHMDEFFGYLDALFSPARDIAAIAKLQAQIQELWHSNLSATEKNSRLDERLEAGLAALQSLMRELSPSAWLRTARIYEIFPRAFNLDGWRSWDKQKFFADFSAKDFADIKSMGYDTLWTMGIFPIGLRGRIGTTGSPYSIRDHASVNPELGSEQDFKAFVDRAHAAGLKVIIDFVPNHTSMDSRLLAEHPEYFIHRETEGDPQAAPEGYFPYHSESLGRWIWVSHGGYDYFGSRAYWKDTAQLDYSRQDTRDALAAIAADWIKRAGVDGFRVDMAYQLTNSYFSKLWQRETQKGEFMAQLIDAGRRQNPAAAYIAEAYAERDTLSAAGFDSLYNKNDMDTKAGQYGWYDAWMSGEAQKIREAIRAVSFLTWQQAGATGTQFIGNHDEAAPQRQETLDGNPISGLGRLWRAAAVMTLLLPGNLLFYGSQEIGFDSPSSHDFPKAIPFAAPASVNWSSWAFEHAETSQFFRSLFEQAQEIRNELGPGAIVSPLEFRTQSWVGYLIESPSNPAAPIYAVLANPTEDPIHATAYISQLNLNIASELPAGEARILRLESPAAHPASDAAEQPVKTQNHHKAIIKWVIVAVLVGKAVEAVASYFATPWIISHYALIAAAAGIIQTVIFLFFPVVQIATNQKNLRAGENLKGVSPYSQMTYVAGNFLNLPSFLANAIAAFTIGSLAPIVSTLATIVVAMVNGIGSWIIISQVAAGGTFARWKWALTTIGAALLAAAVWPILTHAWLIPIMGSCATAIFTIFAIPQLLANRRALITLKDPNSDSAAREEALKHLKDISPFYMLLCVVGNLFQVTMFMSIGHLYNIVGNAVGIIGPLLILSQLVQAKLFHKNRLIAIAVSAALWSAYFMVISHAAGMGIWHTGLFK